MKDKRMRDYRIENKPLMIIATAAFFILGVLAVIQQSPTSGKIFGDGNFYTSNVGVKSNPKETYNKVFANNVLAGTACNTIAKTCEDLYTVQGNYWIVNRDSGITNVSDFDKYKVSENSLSITPYKNGDYIISPTNLKFTNSNTTLNPSNGQRYIEATIGSEYIIRWDDVECWWCHIGKTDNDSHTARVGYGGSPSSVISGIVIGQAKSSTKVTLRKLDENGNPGEQVSLSVLYFN